MKTCISFCIKNKLWILVALVWGVLWHILGPNFSATDAVVFKEAAINLAQGRGFVAILLPGNHSTDPLIYAGYPPGFPMFYALYTWIVGLGVWQDTYFTFFLGTVCSLLWVKLARKHNAPKFFYLFIALLFPVGTLANGTDRPEVLSQALILAAVLLLKNDRSSLAWIIAGITALVSPLGGIVVAFALALLTLVHPHFANDKLQVARYENKFGLLLKGGLIASIPVIIVLGLFALYDPTYLPRLSGHGVGTSTGLGIFLSALKSHNWEEIGTLYFGTWNQHLAVLLIVGSLLAVMLLLLVNAHQKRSLILLAGLLPGLFTLMCFPRQPYYGMLVRNITLAIWMVFPSKLVNSRLLTLAMLACLMGETPVFVRDSLVRYAEKDTFQMAEQQIDILRNHMKNNHDPARDYVAVSSSHYMLAKKAIHKVVSLDYAGGLSEGKPLSAVILSTGGRRMVEPTLPESLAPFFETMLTKPTKTEATKIGKTIISQSANTWEMFIYTNHE